MEKIKKQKNQDGSTMVSVIAAFVILMIAVAMLYTAIITSMNLLARARRNDVQTVEALEKFYKTYQENASSGVETIQLTPSTGRYGGFTVKGVLKNTEITIDTEDVSRSIHICNYQYTKNQSQAEAG